MKNSICKIYRLGTTGTGYFCKIPHNSKLLPFFITTNHLLNKEDLEYNEYNKEIKISLKNENGKDKYLNIF